jgi:hypothetical protein
VAESDAQDLKDTDRGHCGHDLWAATRRSFTHNKLEFQTLQLAHEFLKQVPTKFRPIMTAVHATTEVNADTGTFDAEVLALRIGNITGLTFTFRLKPTVAARP